MNFTKLVSIILVNYNGSDVLLDCLNSIVEFIPQDDCEIILVDNNSQDNSLALIDDRLASIKLIKLANNVGFGAGNNAGIKMATGKFLFLLNTDTILTSNILPDLIEIMNTNPAVGIIGPKLLFPDGSFQISFSPEIGIKGESEARKLHQDAQYKLSEIEQKFQNPREVDIVVGAALFMRTDLFNSLGGFDENFFMYFEESDLCLRARNEGYKILYNPLVSLVHLRGHSVKKISNKMVIEYRRSQIYYYHKHRPVWEILILKIHLLFKFLWEYIKTANHCNLEVIKLIFTHK